MAKQSDKSLCVISAGDPRSPKLWSATPYNIIQALEKKSWEIQTIDASSLQRDTPPPEGAAGKNKFQQIIRGLKNRKRSRKLGKAVAQAAGKLNSHGQGVLHLHAFSYLPLINPPKGLKQYLVIDSTSHTWSQHTAFQTYNLSKKIADWLMAKTYRQMDHIFAIGEYVRDDLINHYNISSTKVTAVGTGRGPIAPYHGIKDYKNGHILTVAKERFNEKGTDLLVEGFKIAIQHKPDLRLKIVGKSCAESEVEGIPNVEITGFLSNEELQQLFEDAALFAMPAKNEPWGLVYLEALSCQTPVLGLNRNAIPEITHNGEYGYMIDEPTPQAIAKQLIHAANHPEELAIKGLKGQSYCLNRYTWQHVASHIESALLDR